MDEPIAADAETSEGELAQLWLAPHGNECLPCYLDRAVTAFGCQGDVRFAARYRDLVAPRATALEARLANAGGYCDCEVLMNAMQPAWHLWKPRRWEEVDGCEIEYEPEPPAEMPPCTRVRSGSTQPCLNWHAMVRPRWSGGRR